MYKATKTTRARTSTAVPAKTAFIPASHPPSNQHWKKAATRKAKTVQLSKTAGSVGRPNAKAGKNRMSEYDDKFVEWDVPPENSQHVHDKQYRPTGFYELDMNSAEWKSEQKRQYIEKNGEDVESQIAGMNYPPHQDIPAAFAWELADGEKENSNNGAPPTSTLGRGRSSEHDSKYGWPEYTERTKSMKPAKVVHSSPIALDPAAVLNNAQQWHSEYDDRCAELRRKQKELLQTAAAGTANVPHADIPAFYAWEEGEEEPQPQEIPVQPESRGFKRGTSEYKMKFVEWPLPDQQLPISHKSSSSLDLFHNTGGMDAAMQERNDSVLHHDYPPHDVLTLTGKVGPVSTEDRRRDANPKAFAWSLVDGQYMPEYEEEEAKLRAQKLRAKNLTLNNTCSEYTSKFVEPPSQVYTHLTQPLKPPAAKQLDLFDHDSSGTATGSGTAGAAAEESKNNMTSEYDAEFHALPLPECVETAADIAAKRVNNCPAQFAWSLVEQGAGEKKKETAAEEEPSPRPRRPLGATQDASEYARKFVWPASVGKAPTRFRPQKEGEEQGGGDGSAGTNTGAGNGGGGGGATHHSATADSIIGLDVADLSPGKWQSEYDEQCARLRQKQQALLAGTAVSHVAGVASKKKDKIPSNYAWEDVPPPPAAADQAASLAAHEPRDEDELPHSEYDDEFKKWPISQRNAIVPPKEENLNIFEASEAGCTGTASGESKTAVEPPVANGNDDSTSKAMESEYDAKFRELDLQKAKQNSYTAQRGEPLPAQFAWPLVDPPAPPSEKPVAEFEFDGQSEYDASFQWKQPAANGEEEEGAMATAGAPSSAPHLSCMDDDVIVMDVADEDASKWVSEYDAHAVEAVHPTPTQEDEAHLPPAGLITIKHDEIPHFYAWMDKELGKGGGANGKKKGGVGKATAAAPSRPRYSASQVKTEHDEHFVPHVVEKPDIVKPAATAVNYDLLKYPSDPSPNNLASEYDDKFVEHTAEEVSGLENPYGTDRSSAIEVPKPPQFAWSLLEKDQAKEAPPAVAAPKKKKGYALPPTEYDAQYVWPNVPSTQDEAAMSMAKAMKLHNTTTTTTDANKTPIPVDLVNQKASEWASEYDDRCAVLRKKQQELTMKSNEAMFVEPVAGIVTQSNEDAPTYYAWEPLSASQPVAISKPTPAAGAELTTEYASSFKPWKTAPPQAVDTSNRRGQDSRYAETFKTFTFGNDRKFHGLTEYDDQFRAKTPVGGFRTLHENHEQLTERMDAKYGTSSLIIPDPPLDPVEDYGANFAPAASVTVDSELASETETSKNFTWPDTYNRPPPVPTMNSQRSNVIIGLNHPSVMGKGGKGLKKPFRSAKQYGSKAGRGAGSGSSSDFGESEYDAKYGWPRSTSATRGSGTGGGSSTAASTASDKRAELQQEEDIEEEGVTLSSSKKYRLMSKEIKSRQQQAATSGGRRTDYTTGVLNASGSNGGASNGGGATAGGAGRVIRPSSATAAAAAGMPSGATGRATVGSFAFGSTSDSLAATSKRNVAAYQPQEYGYGANANATTTAPAGGMSGTGTDSGISVDSLAAEGGSASSSNSSTAVRVQQRHQASSRREQQQMSDTSSVMHDLATPRSIPGLRQENPQLYRSKSVPHRQRLAVAYDSRYPPSGMRSLAKDDTTFNPVLMHKRYPYVSAKQVGRWSTETGDQFKWRKKSNPAPTAVSLANTYH